MPANRLTDAPTISFSTVEGPRHRKETRIDRFKDRSRNLTKHALMGIICTIPPADLALSDTVGGRIYNLVNDSITMENKMLEHGLELGSNSAIIMAEIMGIGMVIARNQRLRKIFENYDEYSELKREQMNGPRKVVSKVVNAPLDALGALGYGVKKMGEKLDRTDNRALSALGKVAIDAGLTNAIGTNGVIMEETMNGTPPSTKRIAALGAIMTTTWMGGAEGIRAMNDAFPAVRAPMHAIGEGFTTAMDIQSPVGAAVMGTVGACLFASGYRLSKYTEQKDLAEQTGEIVTMSDLELAVRSVNSREEASDDLERALASVNFQSDALPSR